jgi:flagellar biosynthetic protein FliR
MRGDLALPFSVVYGFLLTFVRMGAALIFVPIPGMKAGPAQVRVILSVSMTLALFPRWPVLKDGTLSIVDLLAMLAREAGLGLAVGLAVGFIVEGFLLAAQVLSLQSGFSYASTIDPFTQADSGVLVTLAQLLAGLLFFAMGLDQQVLAAFARSLETIPPGSFVPEGTLAATMMHLGAGVFTTGLRLALPIVSLLLMVDIAMALLGRLDAQLQLISLAFPAKILVGIGFLAWILIVFPKVFSESSTHALTAVREFIR